MRPRGFRAPTEFPHGTRSRYTGGACRCPACRAANTAAYRERRQRELELVRELGAVAPAPAVEIEWRPRGGPPRLRRYRRGCPGVLGHSCRRRTFVRKDSPGGICGDCRRRLTYNGLVDAQRARRHLLKLSRKGIGWKSVAAASDVAATVLWDVKVGRKLRIRADTERRILAVDEDARAGASLVPARPTWNLIEQMLAEGYTKKRLAAELGRASSLQLRRDRIYARNELAVRKLYRRLMF